MRWFAAELCRRTSASAAAADRHAVLLLGFNRAGVSAAGRSVTITRHLQATGKDLKRPPA